VLRTNAKGGQLTVLGGGAAWPYRIQGAQGPILFRVALGHELYCAEFTTFRRNRSGKVVARDSPAPADCGGGTPPDGCGNGVVGGAEQCDDGNTTSLDGCSASCMLESTAAICAGVPSVPGTSLTTVQIVSGLDALTFLGAPPLDPTRLFIVEQAGRVRVVKNGTLLADPFIDLTDRVLSGGERGLLSIAFHPHYASNGRFFLYYTNLDGNLVIARYETDPNADTADSTTEKILLTIPHPGEANHNGGQLEFGPDGFLWIGTGDGGGEGDPGGNAQNSAAFLGKLLRVDADVDTPPYYSVPPSNPFARGVRPEVWAKGFRNPWRFSFDRETHDLYIGDVGQDTWEEVDVQPAASMGGENYGWNVLEATHCYPPGATCSTAGFTLPVVEYPHDLNGVEDANGCAIAGGYAYRGCRMPDLRGTYFYGDFCTAFVRTFKGVSGGVAQNEADLTAELAPDGGSTIDNITSFGEDARGELYIVSQSGNVFAIVPR